MTRSPHYPLPLLVLLATAVLVSVTGHASNEPVRFVDPAPPTPAEPDAPPAQNEPTQNPDTKYFADPKPLAGKAKTHDWTDFLGPTFDNACHETHLAKSFGPKGPPVVWEAKKGSGYCGPAVLGERLVLFHRVEGEEVVDCLHALNGKRFWRFKYPSAYVDRYGYSDGPRCSPVIGGDAKRPLVFTYGAEGKLHCFELLTGRIVWARDISKEFRITQNFFGVGATPLVEGDTLIINVGAPKGPCVAAFDQATGKMAWGAAGEGWGPSYASPVPATVFGKRRVFVFAGGESDPPTGGLLCIDPANGAVDFTFAWRGNRRESVNASPPLVIGADTKTPQVLVSECYGAGGVLLQLSESNGRIEAKKVWDNPEFGTHFMLAVEKDGHLYGVDGHGPRDAFLVCVNRATGEEVWRAQPEWTDTVANEGRERKLSLGTYRAWLTPVDGGSRYLVLGEFGHLLWAELSPKGYKQLSRAWLFPADQTWTPPVVSRGLVYVCQNSTAMIGEAPMRLLCYDLRAME